MSWIGDVFRLLAFSQLVTVALYFVLHQRNVIGRLIALLAVCLMAYVLADHSALVDSSNTTYVMYRIATLTPLVLLVIAHHLFVDGGRIHKSIWVLAFFYIAVRFVGIPLYDPGMPNSNLWFVVIYVIPQTIMLYLSVLTIYLAARGYRIDLMEERRNFRVVFVIAIGILLAIRTANAYFSFADPFLDNIWLFTIEPLPDYVFPTYVFIITLGFNQLIFRLHKDAFNLITLPAQDWTIPETPAAPSKGVKGSNQSAIERIQVLMEKERLYATPGFTISDLAQAMSMQEYRLRRLINQGLKYRNFNQFLNHYRIEEASRRLQQSTAPVSTIALDIGYGSLSSFNAAFKARFDMTPTEYRNLHRSGSGV
ncbi:MAG: hypothetical protein RLZZ385_340 [Pseudomonadota bacterium]|jgi:AraC-like DNA-binding protein